MFNHDWFHGTAFVQQQEDAKMRCTLSHFPELKRGTALEDSDFRDFYEAVETRPLVYLRDGFSYEIKQITEPSNTSNFAFECEPVDEQYKVGAFVVSVPYDEIVRVEVFAVHPEEKPEESPQITGFRSRPDHPPHEDGAPPESRHPINEEAT